MSTDTGATGVGDDLTEEDPQDNDLIKKLRKQLKDANAVAKSAQAENEEFRATRTKQRVDALTDAVNGKGYPQSVLDTLVAKVQEADDDEFVTLLGDLQGEAKPEGDVVNEEEPATPAAPTPASLGQELAAAASGGASTDPVMEALLNASSVDEVNAAAKEHGLEDI
jgi:hypothetical protein